MINQSKNETGMIQQLKNKKVLIILGAFMLAGLSLSAQIRQANALFNQFKYSKAIPLYKKAAEDKDAKVRKEATVRLADCYRLMNNANEAHSWYAKAVTFPDVEPVNFYYLGMALRTLANYDEAQTAFLQYSAKVPDDLRGKIYAGYCRDVKKWENLAPSAEIKNAVTLNSAYSDFGPVFYKDGLIIASDRDIDMMSDKNYQWTSYGYLDLYQSMPGSYNDFWSDLSVPEKLSTAFNQPYHDGPACFTADFRQIFTTRTLKNSSSKKDSAKLKTDYLKIFMADLTNDKKIIYTAFPFNSDAYSVGHPAVSKDGKKLIFSSNKPGGYGQSDLYISELTDGKWSEPVNLGPEVNTFGNEVFPFWANDSTLFFSSDGHPGYGGLDIYETNKVNGKWITPWNLKLPLNSPYDDFSIVFDKNLTSGFFSSNRPGGSGSDDIYAFRNYHRTPATDDRLLVGKDGANKEKTTIISGYVKDKSTRMPLEKATVFLLNSTTNEALVLKTDSKGYYEAPVSKGTFYVAKAMIPGYFDDCLNFRTPEERGVKVENLRDLLLDKYALNQVFVVENIYYDLDKWFIREDAIPSLDNLVRILKQYPISVELGSHTDSRATAEYNIELSQKRAESVVRYLILSGINPARLTAKGYGETKLVNKCVDGVPCTEAEHQANRRTEFKITAINAEENDNKNLDPSVFKAGDKIPVQLLGAGFFDGCLENKAVSEVEPPASEPAQQVSPVESKSPVWLSVQLAASVRQVDCSPANFKGEKDIFEKKIGKYYKYYIGHYSESKQAISRCEILKVKFPDAFIVGFNGDQLVQSEQVKEMLTQK